MSDLRTVRRNLRHASDMQLDGTAIVLRLGSRLVDLCNEVQGAVTVGRIEAAEAAVLDHHLEEIASDWREVYETGRAVARGIQASETALRVSTGQMPKLAA
jgi:hypothetical protein